VDGLIPAPLACFVLTPQFLYEVTRDGMKTTWGTVAAIDQIELNDRTQAVVQTHVTVTSQNGLFTDDVGSAILFWENGLHVGIVGPGDLIPGGRVESDPRQVGLSDTGLLLF